MKKRIAFLLALTMLCMAGCGTSSETEPAENSVPADPSAPTESVPDTEPVLEGQTVEILLDGQVVTVDGSAAGEEAAAVYLSRDIIYYEEKTAYDSGNPYGEGTSADMHSPEEADAHLVVNITEPGNYRLSGNLELGQIRIDLGEDAYEDPGAVVTLILDGVSIRCTVAPAIVFMNVYECDGSWSADTARAEVDTAAAGANLILASGSDNEIHGAYVAKIFKDGEGEKKLWKQDGAIYSYMSMNVFGPGTLNLYADNEGLDTELHLTIYGGNLNIWSQNDGINTNEDGVSVTTIQGGRIHIIAGLGAEGDGIDSNGYLVINGGTVVSSANPAADSGLDSDMGSYIHGGTVIAFGAAMDWAESDSDQVTMNLQFARQQAGGSSVVIAREDGSVVFAYDPLQDEVLGERIRSYMGTVISCPGFRVGDSYEVYIGSTITGTETGGVYDVSTVTGFADGTQQAYSGTDVRGGFGGKGGFGSGMGLPEDVVTPGEMPERPENDYTIPEPPGNMGTMGTTGGQRPPEGMNDRPEDWTMPEDWTLPEGEMPEDWTMPEVGYGNRGSGGLNGRGGMSDGEAVNTLFFMQDKVNFFSGLSAVVTVTVN